MTKNSDYSMIFTRLVSDAIMYELFDRIVESQRYERTFVDASVPKDHHSFRDIMKNKEDVHAWIMMKGEDMKGICWITELNRFGVAKVHFTFFADTHPLLALRLSRFFLYNIFRISSDSGERFVKCLHGFTPKNNELAVRFVTRVGVNIIGVLPQSTYNASTDSQEDTVLSYITEADTRSEWNGHL